MKKIEYIDLGLPSSTLWAKYNAHIGKKYHFTYDEAMKHFGDCIPDYDQYRELLDLCKWEWIQLFGGKVKGYRVTGPNRNSIFLSAAGYYDGTSLRSSGTDGYYWSTKYNSSTSAYCLGFNSSIKDMYNSSRGYGRSIRLIKR